MHDLLYTENLFFIETPSDIEASVNRLKQIIAMKPDETISKTSLAGYSMAGIVVECLLIRKIWATLTFNNLLWLFQNSFNLIIFCSPFVRLLATIFLCVGVPNQGYLIIILAHGLDANLRGIAFFEFLGTISNNAATATRTSLENNTFTRYQDGPTFVLYVSLL